MLDYNLNELSSFSLLQLILQNGIALEGHLIDNTELESKLEKVYENILVMNSIFFVDNRFVDFNALEIAISLVTYQAELFGLGSWRNKIAKVYTKKHISSISISKCLVVLRR